MRASSRKLDQARARRGHDLHREHPVEARVAHAQHQAHSAASDLVDARVALARRILGSTRDRSGDPFRLHERRLALDEPQVLPRHEVLVPGEALQVDGERTSPVRALVGAELIEEVEQDGGARVRTVRHAEHDNGRNRMEAECARTGSTRRRGWCGG